MSDGWTIGHIGGIAIRLHPTFLVVVVLVLAGGFGSPLDGAAWVGIVFGSVVMHELAHSFVAKAHGLTVRDIVLLPIGGASEIEGMDRRPRDEFVVAIAGPATSVAVALVTTALVWAAGSAIDPLSFEVGSLPSRLIWVNVMLASFNALPAFPMDGGRVVRAVLARRVGVLEATHRAAAIGRQVAFVMAAVGLLWMPWLIVIAVFVVLAGRAEEESVTARGRPGGDPPRSDAPRGEPLAT